MSPTLAAVNNPIQQLAQSLNSFMAQEGGGHLPAISGSGDSFTLGYTTATGSIWTFSISAPAAEGDPFSVSLTETPSGKSPTTWLSASYTPADAGNNTAASWSLSVTAPVITFKNGASLSTLQLQLAGGGTTS